MSCSSPWTIPGRNSTPGTPGLGGASPALPSSLARHRGGKAKQVFKQLAYDDTLDQTEWQVGFLETQEAQRRESGAEAWSLRLHDRLVELPYREFSRRFEGNVPFHRIAFFKHCGAIVWESDEHRSKLHPGEDPHGSSLQHSSDGWRHGSSFQHGSSSQPHGPSPRQHSAGRQVSGGGSQPGAGNGTLPPPPTAIGFVRPAAASSPPPPPRQERSAARPRPRGGVASLLAAAAEHAAAGEKPQCSGPSSIRGSGSASGSAAFVGSCSPAGGALTPPQPGKPRRGREDPAGVSGGSGGGVWQEWRHDQEAAGPSGAASRGCSTVASSSSSGGSSRDATPTPPVAQGRRWGHSRGLSSGGGYGDVARVLSDVWENGEGAPGPVPPPLPPSSSLGHQRQQQLHRARHEDVDEEDEEERFGVEGAEEEKEEEEEYEDGILQDADWDEEGPSAAGEQEEDQEDEEEGEGRGCEMRDYGDLPEPVWLSVLGGLGVRDLCYLARASRNLRALAVNTPGLWALQYKDLNGEAAPDSWTTQAVRRACRRSELRAARWLQAAPARAPIGFASTTCVALDGSKAVSGDGSCVRVWSHDTGRRIATLPGHPGRLTSVAFDDDTLVSGCTGGVVRLWSMDELRCVRALRHHAGAVAAVALMHGVPISAGEEGEICLWDAGGGAGPGAPILSLAADGPVAALDTCSPAGHLVSAGWEVDGWDMETAQRLFTLAAPRGGAGVDAGAAAGGGGFGCVSSGANLVAAGRAGEVVLWDVRSTRCVGTIGAAASARGAAADAPAAAEPTKQGAGGGGPAAAADAHGEGGPGAAGGFAPAPCVGVQLDDWKLVAGWGPARSLEVYDIRSLSGSEPGARWREPVMTLQAPARVTCFRFHEQTLIAGQEGAECAMWSFLPPSSLARGPTFPGAEGDGGRGSDEGGCGSGPGRGGGGKGRRKERGSKKGEKDGDGSKAPAMTKRERRYPKRRTR